MIVPLAISAFTAAIVFGLYLVVVKGSESPLRFHNRFKTLYKKHSRKKRVKEKMADYKAISGVDRPSFIRSALFFSFFILVIILLLFKFVFFIAVTTNSMQPTFKSGDLVLMQKIIPTPKEGDIIMFKHAEYILPITHRVDTITDGGIRTRGDARDRIDPWVVREEAIMGKAVQLGGSPVVLKDIGNYFILDTKEMSYGKYGLEYSFMKQLFSTIRLYGYVLCAICILGYVILTLREAKKGSK
jgi:signal peptidase